MWNLVSYTKPFILVIVVCMVTAIVLDLSECCQCKEHLWVGIIYFSFIILIKYWNNVEYFIYTHTDENKCDWLEWVCPDWAEFSIFSMWGFLSREAKSLHATCFVLHDIYVRWISKYHCGLAELLRSLQNPTSISIYIYPTHCCNPKLLITITYYLLLYTLVKEPISKKSVIKGDNLCVMGPTKNLYIRKKVWECSSSSLGNARFACYEAWN